MDNLPSSIIVYATCKNMRWAHLPNPGGLYAQDPLLLDDFRVLFYLEAKQREKEQKEQERKSKAKTRR